MWTDYITSISHVLKVNEYGGRQAKGNEKRQCFKGWETLECKYIKYLCLFIRQVRIIIIVDLKYALCLIYKIVS